ncbi:hypothetical protein B0H21DRAFT_877490 [Amylocystis lapponica]|nr:hypothetical protein B0H21DRAFT_877490 [Amylocystis lapponica]
MARRWLFVVVSLCLVAFAAAQLNNSTIALMNDGFPSDPILQYRPSFARSLPVQILLNGIVLTLSSVLLIHLIFTAQYHWPLAPVNFVLQMSAVTILLVSSVATMQVILSAVTDESRTWPYMLNYVAVNVPPCSTEGWTTAELAAWLLMNATTSALIQITHIQFLTLLYPSGLERRLIFSLLGPLALLSAVMQLMRVHASTNLTSVASAVQNVCNATLSLLFTMALFLWGFCINRTQAWRTDGGTAAFGAGALMLAPMSTAIAFVYIPHRNQYPWMQQLMWAVILWQSFLGWWWWVGAGMGVGEVDDFLRRAEKRQRRQRHRDAQRIVQRERAETFWKDVTGRLGFRPEPRDGGGAEGEERPRGEERPSADPAVARVLGRRVGHLFYGWFQHVCHAHLVAAREQAIERVERVNQAYGREQELPRRRARSRGWGLGSFGARRGVGSDGAGADSEGEGESDAGDDVEKAKSSGEEGRRRERVRRRGARQEAQARSERGEEFRPHSMWWWGPLQRWRLQDATVY